ncbi:MAG TPA: hypothetical protein VLC52_06505 [Anaerolineae bacterium]|nr:hypothetical protein [Anaerolineae bacterium]
MVRTLTFARPAGNEEGPATTAVGRAHSPSPALSCEHRTVSRDGRIVCKKIVDGQAEVSPTVCRQCPFRAVNCQHLRFSLRLSSPSPLLVRYNGRTELWDDGPAELRFDRAACAARVMPIHSPQACAECALRQAACPTPVVTHRPDATASGDSVRRGGEVSPAATELGSGRVVAFPGREVLERSREAVAAAG